MVCKKGSWAQRVYVVEDSGPSTWSHTRHHPGSGTLRQQPPPDRVARAGLSKGAATTVTVSTPRRSSPAGSIECPCLIVLEGRDFPPRVLETEPTTVTDCMLIRNMLDVTSVSIKFQWLLIYWCFGCLFYRTDIVIAMPI